MYCTTRRANQWRAILDMQTGGSTSETIRGSGGEGSRDTNESQYERYMCRDKSRTKRRYHDDLDKTVLTACPGRNITPRLGWNTWSSEHGTVSPRTSDCQLAPPRVAAWVVVAAFEVGQFLRESTRLHAVFRGVLTLLDGPDASGDFLQLPFVLTPFLFETSVSDDFGVGTPLREAMSRFCQHVEAPFGPV